MPVERRVKKTLASVIAVLGPPRSGSSCIAGVLNILGVPMGRSWLPPSAANPKGFFEDTLLNDIRRRTGGGFAPWKGPGGTVPSAMVVRFLRMWRRIRSRNGPLIGGKLPYLLALVPEMEEAWNGQWLAVVPERDCMESARSASPGRFWRRKPPAEIAVLFRAAVDKQNADLDRLRIPTFRIPYAELLNDTPAVVRSLVRFCGLSPTPRQVSQAIAFVDPRLNHHTPL